jgi:RhtB (resistance to homoserine/threonine) family protein
MFGIINYPTFLLAGILLNLTPGSDTMYILGRSIAQGKKAGVLSALGISTGSLVHCLFAALGLSILLAQSAVAFEVVKYAGAGYLIFLGVKSILAKTEGALSPNQASGQSSYARIYTSGIITNVLNPKVALFFLAFLPQFIDPRYAQNALPFLLLGLTFFITGGIWCLLLALFAARLSERLRARPQIKTWLDRVTGGVFVLLGIKLALSER